MGGCIRWPSQVLAEPFISGRATRPIEMTGSPLFSIPNIDDYAWPPPYMASKCARVPNALAVRPNPCKTRPQGLRHKPPPVPSFLSPLAGSPRALKCRLEIASANHSRPFRRLCAELLADCSNPTPSLPVPHGFGKRSPPTRREQDALYS